MYSPRSLSRLAVLILALMEIAHARVVQLRVERRETILGGRSWGNAGPYEKLIGKVFFALNPSLLVNTAVVDLTLAPRNARGEVEFSADFYLLKPVDPSRGNGRLLYEVGNRGGKGALRTFQKGEGNADPSTPGDFGNGLLMNQGYAVLWMGWQWDVPKDRMRMDMPIATDHGKQITGLVRANFVLDTRAVTAPLADREHLAYAIYEPSSPENVMTVRNRPLDPPQRIDRGKWRFADDSTVTLDGGFEPGRIYDVVYRAVAPRVLGCGLAGTRDLVSFLRYSKAETNPIPGVKFVYGWGTSQSGRFLRHFLYQGFNEDEEGRRVLDGVIDEVGGAGRGSFNHRFGQASRDAEQFLNIFYPVDMFPFTDGLVTDPVTGETDGLLARAEARKVAPKIFHVLSNSEYFNRAGSLIHTDCAGKRDVEPPANARIYLVSSTPHYFGAFPPAPTEIMAAPLNPLNRRPISRALLTALDAWVANGTPPPPSRYPHISDGTLVERERAGWPKIPGVSLPLPMLMTYRLDFGPDWDRGIVSFEPPRVGKPFGGLVPAVDRDGHDRAGIHLPAIQLPVATYAGWNFRSASAGSTDQFSGEAGSFHPFARTAAERVPGDSRRSVAERYPSREEYLAKVNASARQLASERFLLAADIPDVIAETMSYFDWAISKDRR
jgi:hypothetical protein